MWYFFWLCCSQVDVSGGRKAVVVHVPYRLRKSFRKIHVRLVRELEKKFSGKVIMIYMKFFIEHLFRHLNQIQFSSLLSNQRKLRFCLTYLSWIWLILVLTFFIFFFVLFLNCLFNFKQFFYSFMREVEYLTDSRFLDYILCIYHKINFFVTSYANQVL